MADYTGNTISPNSRDPIVPPTKIIEIAEKQGLMLENQPYFKCK